MGIAGMIFTLLLVAMIGGFILLVPVSRRLAAYLEQRMRTPEPDRALAGEVRRLEAAVQALQREVEEISDRQTFTDALLADRETAPPRLPPETIDG